MDSLSHYPPHQTLKQSLCEGCKFDQLVYPQAPEGTLAAVSDTDVFWEPGETIVVNFASGQRDWWILTKHYGAKWRANLNFVYPQLGDEIPQEWLDRFPGRQCDMRIGYNEYDPVTMTGGGSYAYLGKWQRVVAANLESITLNLGWFREFYERGDFAELERVTTHEYGHALGLGHEHQNPLRPFVLSEILFEEGIARGRTREQLERTYGAFENPFYVSDFNEISIMCYPLEERHTVPAGGIPWNTVISPLDLLQVDDIYGLKPPGANNVYIPLFSL